MTPVIKSYFISKALWEQFPQERCFRDLFADMMSAKERVRLGVNPKLEKKRLGRILSRIESSAMALENRCGIKPHEFRGEQASAVMAFIEAARALAPRDLTPVTERFKVPYTETLQFGAFARVGSFLQALFEKNSDEKQRLRQIAQTGIWNVEKEKVVENVITFPTPPNSSLVWGQTVHPPGDATKQQRIWYEVADVDSFASCKEVKLFGEELPVDTFRTCAKLRHALFLQAEEAQAGVVEVLEVERSGL